MINELSYTVNGRPAPQGSKKHGAAGQMLEQSAYLPAWRQAIKRTTYQLYVRLGIMPDALPVLRGPVEVGLRFRLAEGTAADGPPDLDKLTRAVWDALTYARVWEDDGRVVRVLWLEKLAGCEPGCDIYVRTERPAGYLSDGKRSVPVWGGAEAVADAAVRLAGGGGDAVSGARPAGDFPCCAARAAVDPAERDDGAETDAAVMALRGGGARWVRPMGHKWCGEGCTVARPGRDT